MAYHLVGGVVTDTSLRPCSLSKLSAKLPCLYYVSSLSGQGTFSECDSAVLAAMQWAIDLQLANKLPHLATTEAMFDATSAHGG